MTACTSSSARTASRSACSTPAIPTASSASRRPGSWRGWPVWPTTAGPGRINQLAERRSPGPGLDLGEHLRALAAQGVRGVVSVPVGFVSDHVEILFDIDHKAAAVAADLGVRLERPPALNDDPVFIAALAELVRGHAATFEESRAA